MMADFMLDVGDVRVYETTIQNEDLVVFGQIGTKKCDDRSLRGRPEISNEFLGTIQSL